MRPSARAADELRPICLTRQFTRHAEGSVLVEFGDTRLICTASIEERVPPFLKGKGRGWVTAEYGMLPRSTHTRTQREASRGRQDGRTLEIQRLVGRSLRAVMDLEALADAVRYLIGRKWVKKNPLHGQVASVSVGIYQGAPVLDLDYAEDSEAETDMNVVMNDAQAFIEIQGTAEGHAFRMEELQAMLELAQGGIAKLLVKQREVLGLPA